MTLHARDCQIYCYMLLPVSLHLISTSNLIIIMQLEEFLLVVYHAYLSLVVLKREILDDLVSESQSKLKTVALYVPFMNYLVSIFLG